MIATLMIVMTAMMKMVMDDDIYNDSDDGNGDDPTISKLLNASSHVFHNLHKIHVLMKC